MRNAGLSRALVLVGLLVPAGCQQFAPSAALQAPPLARGVAQENDPPAQEPGKFIPETAGKIVSLRVSMEPPGAQLKMLPISLDTVLGLARDRNGKIAMARAQLREAFAGQDLARKRWLPDMYLGTSYYRHEGGIQNFNGDLVQSSYGSLFAGTELRGTFDLRDVVFQKIDAERKVWQKRGELSQLTTENLLDAAGTYIDLLAAYSGSKISAELEKKMVRLLDQGQKLAKVDPGLQVEVARILSEIRAQQQISRKLKESTKAAAAKLVYLLGLDPEAELVPVDQDLVIFARPLVSDAIPPRELVERALTNGPGIHDMLGLLALIDQANEKACGPGKYMPVLQVNMAEGAFGAGPGSGSNWDNRFDLALQARWNLTEFLTARERRRVAMAKVQQAQIGYADLRGKLTLGVQEAREASVSGREQADMGVSQIKHATEAYNLSSDRFLNRLKGASPSEVLMSIRALGGAHLNHLNAVRDHDKAQLRLFILTGQLDCPEVSE